jgi:hypothetical protein
METSNLGADIEWRRLETLRHKIRMDQTSSAEDILGSKPEERRK